MEFYNGIIQLTEKLDKRDTPICPTFWTFGTVLPIKLGKYIKIAT